MHACRSALATASGVLIAVSLAVVPAQSVLSSRADAASAPRVSPSVAVPGQLVMVKGRLTTSVARKVVVRSRTAGSRKWIRTATGKANSKGKYRIEAKAPVAVGSVSWRVTAPKARVKGRSYPWFKSATVTTKVTAPPTPTPTPTPSPSTTPTPTQTPTPTPTPIPTPTPTPTPLTELEALIAIKNANPEALTDWTGPDFCTWTGVTCDDDEHVTGLQLNNALLARVPAEIGSLTNLTVLTLVSSQLTSIPAEIGNLTNLTYLSLHANQLSGDVSGWAKPLSVSANLSQLILLDNGCLNAGGDTVLAAWLTGIASGWQGGC